MTQTKDLDVAKLWVACGLKVEVTCDCPLCNNLTYSFETAKILKLTNPTYQQVSST